MDTQQTSADPAAFLASLERRHEEVMFDIDRLAERVEKTLLEFKPPATFAERTATLTNTE